MLATKNRQTYVCFFCGFGYTIENIRLFMAVIDMRPLGQLRKYLILRLLHDDITQLGKQSARELDKNNIEILHIEQNDKDFLMQYRVGEKEAQAIFMRAMLYAEVKTILDALEDVVGVSL